MFHRLRFKELENNSYVKFYLVKNSIKQFTRLVADGDRITLLFPYGGTFGQVTGQLSISFEVPANFVGAYLLVRISINMQARLQGFDLMVHITSSGHSQTGGQANYNSMFSYKSVGSFRVKLNNSIQFTVMWYTIDRVAKIQCIYSMGSWCIIHDSPLLNSRIHSCKTVQYIID